MVRKLIILRQEVFHYGNKLRNMEFFIILNVGQIFSYCVRKQRLLDYHLVFQSSVALIGFPILKQNFRDKNSKTISKNRFLILKLQFEVLNNANPIKTVDSLLFYSLTQNEISSLLKSLNSVVLLKQIFKEEIISPIALNYSFVLFQN